MMVTDSVYFTSAAVRPGSLGYYITMVRDPYSASSGIEMPDVYRHSNAANSLFVDGPCLK